MRSVEIEFDPGFFWISSHGFQAKACCDYLQESLLCHCGLRKWCPGLRMCLMFVSSELEWFRDGDCITQQRVYFHQFYFSFVFLHCYHLETILWSLNQFQVYRRFPPVSVSSSRYWLCVMLLCDPWSYTVFSTSVSSCICSCDFSWNSFVAHFLQTVRKILFRLVLTHRIILPVPALRIPLESSSAVEYDKPLVFLQLSLLLIFLIVFRNRANHGFLWFNLVSKWSFDICSICSGPRFVFRLTVQAATPLFISTVLTFESFSNFW